MLSSFLRRPSKISILILIALLAGGAIWAGFPTLPASSVAFSQSTHDLETYDYIEITATVSGPRPSNPFTDAALHGTFTAVSNAKNYSVQGFADSDDGRLFRIRFMPSTPGDYTFSIEYRQGWWRSTSSGTFHVSNGGRRGPVRIDPANRWHFIWEGTGEHYFFNGATAYWLMGWQDEQVIGVSLERLHKLEINRVRVTVSGRTDKYYGEPVMPGPTWTPLLTPWPAGRSTRWLHYLGRAGQRWGRGVASSWFDLLAEFGEPNDVYHPGFDYSRFHVAYWQKFERALRFARDRDLIFSLVLDMNDSHVHPGAGSADERRFIQYAVARFGAFSNITWDLGDDLDQYRDDAWTHATGTLIKDLDPYQHLATSHPVNNAHQDRTADWFDFTSFQEWSRQQHAFMLDQRKQQERLGRIIPQTNEEYGYEDHYPLWAEGPPAESADVLRRTAWEIAMAGGYQTAGETARRGTNIRPDSGGGWMNGRGDDTMTMFQGYRRMVDFFTSFDWWTAEPHDELAGPGSFCLAKPGSVYVLYLPHGGHATLHVQPGRYVGTWLNAATGEKSPGHLVGVTASPWISPNLSPGSDWALLLLKEEHSSTLRRAQ